jgi:hypothetical protein
MDLLNIIISLIIGILSGWVIAYFYYDYNLSKKCGDKTVECPTPTVCDNTETV